MNADAGSKPRPTDLASEVNISLPYASQILSGKKVPPIDLALRVWRRYGLKLGDLVGASDADIEAVGRVCGSGQPEAEGGQGEAPRRPFSRSSSRASSPAPPAAAEAAE